jgi:hypothetical protein
MREHRTMDAAALVVPFALVIAFITVGTVYMFAAHPHSTPETVAAAVFLVASATTLVAWVVINDHRVRARGRPGTLSRAERRQNWMEFERDFWSYVGQRDSEDREADQGSLD